MTLKNLNVFLTYCIDYIIVLVASWISVKKDSQFTFVAEATLYFHFSMITELFERAEQL